MRKSAGVLTIIAAMAFFASTVAWAGMGFRVMGGFSHIAYGDFNAFIDTTNTGFGGMARMDNINWVPEIAGEFYYSLMPMLELGIGAGIISGKSDFSISTMNVGASFKHTVKVYPFTTTAYFYPQVPFITMKPYAYGGVGMYYSRITFETSGTFGGDSDGYDADLTDWGFGLHGGGGIEFFVMRTVSFDIGFKVRWADMKGFEGTATDFDGNTRDVFYVSDEIGGYLVYGLADVAEKDDYDEGSVDLSGYSLYAGIKIGF